MGRKASKATDNIYYIARTEAAKNNEIYTSREKAAVRLGIERSRLARIELDQIEPYAEEAPNLCTDFCDNMCPIGIHKLEEQAKHTDKDSIERLVLRFLSSSQYMDEFSKILVNITQDGKIDNTEIKDMQDIFKAMDSVLKNIEAIKFWVMNDPQLRPYFKDSQGSTNNQ